MMNSKFNVFNLIKKIYLYFHINTISEKKNQIRKVERMKIKGSGK